MASVYAYFGTTSKYMREQRSSDPLHGITLEQMVNRLVERHGWAELGKRITIRCFTSDPSVKSSLKFLRRTPWARQKVEALYLATVVKRKHRPKTNTVGTTP